MITSFPIPSGRNIGGNVSLQFATYPSISALPPVINSKITSAVVFTANSRFFDAYSTIDKQPFSEQSANDDNGPSYSWQITGFYAGDNDVIADLFAELANYRHIVLVKDQNNRLRLVGWNAPLTFTYTYNSGTAPGDAKGYAFQFAGTSTRPAPFYMV